MYEEYGYIAQFCKNETATMFVLKKTFSSSIISCRWSVHWKIPPLMGGIARCSTILTNLKNTYPRNICLEYIRILFSFFGGKDF